MCINCTHGVFDAKKAILQAIEDYRRHTTAVEVLDEVSEEFVERLARDSWKAKSALRNLFSKSPVWNEELQALVINGNRTHNPNYCLINSWIYKLIAPLQNEISVEKWKKITLAVKFFTCPNDDRLYSYINALKEIAPKAYHEGKKKSRILKDFFKQLGVVDNTAGSDFQKLYAKIADEISAKKIDFKLYVSINPAHFLTMSNPKNDTRGATMVSCHSLNSTEYSYNCGCSGYARDPYTFIVFTVSDDNNPETLNNRKTSRQIFAYMPNNGVLLQSRMYLTKNNDSYGGVDGDTEEGKLYRDLIQREISPLENVPNLWKTDKYYNNKFDIEIIAGFGFGGYTDWTYEVMGARISVRFDHTKNFEEFEVGTYGLCIRCGDETAEGLYCEDCKYNTEICEECGERCSETWIVHGRDGEYINVCEDCLNDCYVVCEHCEEYYHIEDVEYVSNGVCVCQDCLNDYYTICEECGEYCPNDYTVEAVDACGNDIYICEDCAECYYVTCENCGCLVHSDNATETEDGYICPNCTNDKEGETA